MKYEKNYIIRADNHWVVNSVGRIIKFTEKGAAKWVRKHKPQSFSFHVMNSKR